MTKTQIAEQIILSSTFDRRGYADANSLTGFDSDETIDNIVLHLSRLDSDDLNMFFEANCEEEVRNWYSHRHAVEQGIA